MLWFPLDWVVLREVYPHIHWQNQMSIYINQHRASLTLKKRTGGGFDKNRASFILHKNLWFPNTITLDSVVGQKHFLCHQGYILKVHSFGNNDLFKNDSSFSGTVLDLDLLQYKISIFEII